MAYYFVDFENVNSGGLRGIEELSPEDIVLVLYSQKAHFLDVGCVSKILNKPLKINFAEIQNGTPNALDFQLVVFATNAICQKQSDEYVIVTNDKGFDAAIAGWKTLYGVHVKRVPCIFAHRHTEVCTQCPPDGTENCEEVANCPANLASRLYQNVRGKTSTDVSRWRMKAHQNFNSIFAGKIVNFGKILFPRGRNQIDN